MTSSWSNERFVKAWMKTLGFGLNFWWILVFTRQCWRVVIDWHYGFPSTRHKIIIYKEWLVTSRRLTVTKKSQSWINVTQHIGAWTKNTLAFLQWDPWKHTRWCSSLSFAHLIHIEIWIPGKNQLIFNQYITIFVQGNETRYVICKIAAILSRPQCGRVQVIRIID